MDEAFYENQAIEKKQIQTLMKKDDRQALFRFGVQFSFFWLASIVAIYYNRTHVTFTVIAIFVQAWFVPSMFAIGHETVHRTAFRSPWLNEWMGALACISIFYVPEWFRQFHFAHHRHTNDPQLDPELAPFGRPSPLLSHNLPLYLSFLSGLPLLAFKIFIVVLTSLPLPQHVWKKYQPYIPRSSQQRLQKQARILFLVYGTIGWIGLTYFPGLFLLLIGQTIGHAILAVFLVAEHNGRPHQGSILERTRTTDTNKLIRYLMWNMPFHAEHHAYPAVPWHALPALHRILEPKLIQNASSYTSYHQKIAKQLFQNKAFIEKDITQQS